MDVMIAAVLKHTIRYVVPTFPLANEAQHEQRSVRESSRLWAQCNAATFAIALQNSEQQSARLFGAHPAVLDG